MKTQLIYNILSNIFKGVDLTNTNDKGYVMVHCPFHHDTTQSAGLNPLDGFFKCFTCGCEYQFDQFISKYYNINDYKQLEKYLKQLEVSILTSNEVDEKHKLLLNNIAKLFKIQALGISLDVIKQCKLCDNNQSYEVSIPVTIDGMLLGYKYYTSTPNENMVKSFVTSGIPNGTIIPFDIWKIDNRPTLICEGEKDMMVARTHGFNAITLIGGCNALPKGWELYFKDKDVAICYDNDEAGRLGGVKLADWLFKQGARVKLVTNYYEVIRENKEDITDFFVKYKKDYATLATYINSTPYWTQEDSNKLKEKDMPIISLDKCLDTKHLNKFRQSIIQVKAEDGGVKSIPKVIKFTWKDKDKNDLFKTYTIDINQDTIDYVIHLIQSLATRKDVMKNIAHQVAWENDLYRKMNLGKYVGYEFSKEEQPLFISLVSPYIESEIVSNKMQNESINETLELVSYSFERLEASKVYTITYKTFANDYSKRNVELLVKEIEHANNSIASFKITDETKQILDTFKATNIGMKVIDLYNNIKYNGIAHLDFDLWLANELTFHSCLYFNLNNKVRRGTIYTNVIGDTRVGKSEISQHLVQQYKQGKFLNAKLSTVTSIVGGYDDKSKFVKAGVLPKNNRGLLVMEELHGLGNDYFKKVTEVKSSGKVSINRVNGELSLECNVRLVEISNPKSNDEKMGAKSVSEFPHGVDIIKSLILNPEDIARNDIYVIIKKSKYINPYDHNIKIEPIPKHYHQEKIKWVWSRGVDNIKFENEKYIWEQANALLNSKFDCDGLSLLGSEAYIKVAKMSIALAMMLCSTTDYENILVKNEHVDYIIEWLTQLYSNETMKIDRYVEEEKSYSTYTQKDIDILQSMFMEWGNAILHLENMSETTKDLLIQFSGKKPNETGSLFADLSINKFIKSYSNNKIVPTSKFRQVVKHINKENNFINSF